MFLLDVLSFLPLLSFFSLFLSLSSFKGNRDFSSQKTLQEDCMQDYQSVNNLMWPMLSTRWWGLSQENRLGKETSRCQSTSRHFRSRMTGQPIFWNVTFPAEHQAKNSGSPNQTSLPKDKAQVFSGLHILSLSTCLLTLLCKLRYSCRSMNCVYMNTTKMSWLYSWESQSQPRF